MSSTRYNFSGLQAHTNSIRVGAQRAIRKHRVLLNQAFSDFNKFIAALERMPPSLDRNVKLELSCKVFNHVYSGLILAESGLTVDAIVCERSAWEAIAFHWLVCADPEAASEYEKDDVSRPVEVRRRLEKLGVDISLLREVYSMGCGMAHVGRQGERFDNRLQSPMRGSLLFGGKGSLADQEYLLGYMPRLLYIFQQPPTTKVFQERPMKSEE